MARLSTTSDAFNALGEPMRRALLDALGSRERSVNELVDALGLTQPQVSKHLRVLREVDLVRVREEGRSRFYSVNGPELKPIHDWIKGYEEMWTERFEALDDVLGELKDQQQRSDA